MPTIIFENCLYFSVKIYDVNLEFLIHLLLDLFKFIFSIFT